MTTGSSSKGGIPSGTRSPSLLCRREVSAVRGPLTSAELARRTQTSERYIREWLNAHAASGYVQYLADSGRYRLTPEQAMLFADENSPAFIIGGPAPQRDEALHALELIADTFLSVSTPVQAAAARLLRDGTAVRTAIQQRLLANVTAAKRLVAEYPACNLLPVEGGWSLLVRVPASRSEEQIVLNLLEPVRIALGVDEDFRLGHVEVEAAVRHPIVTRIHDLAVPMTVVAYVLVKKLYVRETLGEPTPVPGEEAKAADEPF